MLWRPAGERVPRVIRVEPVGTTGPLDLSHAAGTGEERRMLRIPAPRIGAGAGYPSIGAPRTDLRD
jgi:hypothetical protein